MDTTKSYNIFTTPLFLTMVGSGLIFYYIIMMYKRLAPQLLGQFVVASITLSNYVQVTLIVCKYCTANLHTHESRGVQPTRQPTKTDPTQLNLSGWVGF